MFHIKVSYTSSSSASLFALQHSQSAQRTHSQSSADRGKLLLFSLGFFTRTSHDSSVAGSAGVFAIDERLSIRSRGRRWTFLARKSSQLFAAWVRRNFFCNSSSKNSFRCFFFGPAVIVCLSHTAPSVEIYCRQSNTSEGKHRCWCKSFISEQDKHEKWQRRWGEGRQRKVRVHPIDLLSRGADKNSERQSDKLDTGARHDWKVSLPPSALPDRREFLICGLRNSRQPSHCRAKENKRWEGTYEGH